MNEWTEGEWGARQLAERKLHFAFSAAPGAALSKTRATYRRCQIACSKSRKKAFSFLLWSLSGPARVFYTFHLMSCSLGVWGFSQAVETLRDAWHLPWNLAGGVCVSGAKNGPLGTSPGKRAEGVSRGPKPLAGCRIVPSDFTCQTQIQR